MMVSKRKTSDNTSSEPVRVKVMPQNLMAMNRAKAALNRGQVEQAIQAIRAVDAGLSERLLVRLERIKAEILELGS